MLQCFPPLGVHKMKVNGTPLTFILCWGTVENQLLLCCTEEKKSNWYRFGTR